MRTTWAKVIHRRPAAGLDSGFDHVYLLPRTEAPASERKLHRPLSCMRLNRNVRRELSDRKYNTGHRYEHTRCERIVE